MAELIWTSPALDQLDEIAEYIALDKPDAARKLVGNVFDSAEKLAQFPQSGRVPPELPDSVYREVVCPPCRVFYRQERGTVLILHVMREERQLRQYWLEHQE